MAQDWKAKLAQVKPTPAHAALSAAIKQANKQRGNHTREDFEAEVAREDEQVMAVVRRTVRDYEEGRMTASEARVYLRDRL